ncbi:MAG: complex I NDUFA9 subunit family protein [Chromatiales bacterium]
MMITTVAVLGGTGFVGRHLVNRLHKDGCHVRVLTRRRERHRELLVIPTLELIEVDVHDAGCLAEALTGCDAVINLVGILNERGDDGRDFQRAHVALTDELLTACRRLGISRLLHMSALRADPAGPSHYLKSKGEAEELVRGAAATGLQATCFRPSVIFGPEDSFLNRFAALLHLLPVLPLARPDARFAPVYVGDVVEAFARTLTSPASVGQHYDLCGPRVYTLYGLVEYVRSLTGSHCWIVRLGDRLSILQANIMEYVPGKPFSRDNLRSLSVDSVCTHTNGLLALGITPTPMEGVAPQYLADRNIKARYAEYRSEAGRARAN